MNTMHWICCKVKVHISYLYLFFVFVCIYVSGSVYWILTDNSVNLELTERQSCPVCFGESICHVVSRGRLFIPRISRLSFFEQTTYSGTLTLPDGAEKSVVIKRLAKNYAFRELEYRLCSLARYGKDCNLVEALQTLVFVRDPIAFWQGLSELPTQMFVCPSIRLMDQISEKYKEVRGFIKDPGDKQQRRAHALIWTTATINAEPLLLQTFPREEKWPFPTYYGACGRMIVVEDCGSSLANYYNSPWNERVNLALQLLQIAERLSNNKEEYGLYMLDVTYDTFAVSNVGDVTLVDLQHIAVVDKKELGAIKPRHWDDVHEAPLTECVDSASNSCDKYSQTQLCGHVTSDHNFYVICRYILTQTYDVDGRDVSISTSNGFLHGMPDAARNDWDLEYLLNECVMPKRQRGRFQVVHKLIEALTQLHTS